MDDWKSIQTSSMPSVMVAVLPQLRSLGWKIHSRCCSSSVEQPAARRAQSERTDARRVQRFIMGLRDSDTGRKFHPLSPRRADVAPW
jgi:hypothetical protein